MGTDGLCSRKVRENVYFLYVEVQAGPNDETDTTGANAPPDGFNVYKGVLGKATWTFYPTMVKILDT